MRYPRNGQAVYRQERRYPAADVGKRSEAFKMCDLDLNYVAWDKVCDIVHRAFALRFTARQMRHRFSACGIDGHYFEAYGLAHACDDGYVLQLLAGHFSTRLGNEKWIIHDLGRGKAAIYAPRLWRIADFSLPEGIAPSRREEAFRDLWKEYFHSIAVRSRENPRLQRQFMPKKYWKHLPEKEPPAE